MSKKNRSKREANPHGKAETVDKSKWIPQDDKIDFELIIRERDDITKKQKELIDIILDKNTKVVFINGPAGTSKTWCAIYCGLVLLKERKISNINYIRTIIESASKSLGSLPGNEGEKMEPFLIPLMDKLDEFLPALQRDKLIKERRIKGNVVNYLRGANFNAQYTICDESQNFTLKEITTAITRLGHFSKMIFLADPDQSDINGKSGFLPMFDLFNDEESRQNGIHCFTFTKDDIVRSGILKYICSRIEMMKKPAIHEPMFPVK